MQDSRIYDRNLLISYAVIVVFSTRIFWNLRIEWLLRCKALELESLKVWKRPGFFQ